MAKLILLLAIIIVVVLIIRGFVRKAGSARQAETTQPADEPAQEAKLVRCVACGAFVPKAEALAVPNGFRCGSGCAGR